MPNNQDLAGFFTTLVSFLNSKGNKVNSAWLGYLLSQDKQHHLFLAIDHAPGELESIMNMAGMFRNIHGLDPRMQLVTTERSPEYLDIVRKTGYCFFKRGHDLPFAVAMLEQWAKPELVPLLHEAIRGKKLFAAVAPPESGTRAREFAVFEREGVSFSPLFENTEFISQSRLLPADGSYGIQEVIGDQFLHDIYPRASTVVINPRSMFEGHLHIKAML